MKEDIVGGRENRIMQRSHHKENVQAAGAEQKASVKGSAVGVAECLFLYLR